MQRPSWCAGQFYRNSVSIPANHLPLVVDGVSHDLTHLNAFSTSIPGKGVDGKTDLVMNVVFSNHVFTERTLHGEKHHTFDHHGTKRTFDLVRYEVSKSLGALIKAKIMANDLTHISKSYGGVDNLIFVTTNDGSVWAVVYCLQPLSDSCSVRMEILSCHPKIIDSKSISRRNLSYFARICVFGNHRVPKG